MSDCLFSDSYRVLDSRFLAAKGSEEPPENFSRANRVGLRTLGSFRPERQKKKNSVLRHTLKQTFQIRSTSVRRCT